MARQAKNAPTPKQGARKKQQQPAAADPAQQGRVAQMLAVWKMTRENDSKLLPVVVGSALGVIALLVVVGVLIGHVILFSIVGVPAGLLTGTALFGRRATG